MLVNECSLYRHSKPFSSILSKEQEEVAFQVLNCLRASAQSSLRISHRILNYYYWAFFQPAGAQVSYLTNAFSSQESRVCSACPWGAAPLLSAGQEDSSMRHLQMQQSLCWTHLIHILCRQNIPERFLHIAGWPRRKSGRCWRSPAAPSFLCLEERVWTSDHPWPCRDLLCLYSAELRFSL